MTFLHLGEFLSFDCFKQEHIPPIKMKISNLNKAHGTSVNPKHNSADS